MIQFTSFEITLWTSAWSGFGILVGHRLTLGNKANRKREFVAFLNEWRAELQAKPAYFDDVWTPYRERIGQFNAVASKVRNDFWRRKRFNRLCANLTGLDKQNTQGNPQEHILAGVDAMLAFCG